MREDGSGLHAPTPTLLVARDIQHNIHNSRRKDHTAAIVLLAIAISRNEELLLIGLLQRFDLDILEGRGLIVLQRVLLGRITELIWTLAVPCWQHVEVTSPLIAIASRIEDNGCVVVAGNADACSQASGATTDDENVDNIVLGHLC